MDFERAGDFVPVTSKSFHGRGRLSELSEFSAQTRHSFFKGGSQRFAVEIKAKLLGDFPVFEAGAGGLVKSREKSGVFG